MRKLLRVTALLLVAGWIAISVLVEVEGRYVEEELGGGGNGRALVLYHPSRDARFSDELSLAVADGFKTAGLSVERATLTGSTPARPEGYAIIAVVSNTYYGAPDLPTLHYLKRARFDGVAAIGLIGGLGSTDRSQRVLSEALRSTGATLIDTRSYWIWRPNAEDRSDKSNRDVALELARQFGLESGKRVLGAGAPTE